MLNFVIEKFQSWKPLFAGLIYFFINNLDAINIVVQIFVGLAMGIYILIKAYWHNKNKGKNK